MFRGFYLPSLHSVSLCVIQHIFLGIAQLFFSLLHSSTAEIQRVQFSILCNVGCRRFETAKKRLTTCKAEEKQFSSNKLVKLNIAFIGRTIYWNNWLLTALTKLAGPFCIQPVLLMAFFNCGKLYQGLVFASFCQFFQLSILPNDIIILSSSNCRQMAKTQTQRFDFFAQSIFAQSIGKYLANNSRYISYHIVWWKMDTFLVNLQICNLATVIIFSIHDSQKQLKYEKIAQAGHLIF